MDPNAGENFLPALENLDLANTGGSSGASGPPTALVAVREEIALLESEVASLLVNRNTRSNNYGTRLAELEVQLTSLTAIEASLVSRSHSILRSVSTPTLASPSSSTMPTVTTKGLKLPDLRYFDGTSHFYRRWEAELKSFMKIQHFDDDDKRIYYVGTRLQSRAYDWHAGLALQDAKEKLPLFHDFALYLEALNAMFDDTNAHLLADEKLDKFQMGKLSVKDFFISFETLFTESSYFGSALMESQKITLVLKKLPAHLDRAVRHADHGQPAAKLLSNYSALKA